MQKQKTTFWIGIGFIIIGISILFLFVKETTLTCSKITSKCSIETKSFMGQKEGIANYDLKTIKKAEFVTTETYSRKHSNRKRSNGNYNSISKKISNYEYNYTYKPVLLTANGEIEFGNTMGLSRTQKITQAEVLAIAQNSEYGIIVQQFNNFLTSDAQQNFAYESKADTVKTIMYVFIAVGTGLLLI